MYPYQLTALPPKKRYAILINSHINKEETYALTFLSYNKTRCFGRVWCHQSQLIPIVVDQSSCVRGYESSYPRA